MTAPSFIQALLPVVPLSSSRLFLVFLSLIGSGSKRSEAQSDLCSTVAISGMVERKEQISGLDLLGGRSLGGGDFRHGRGTIGPCSGINHDAIKIEHNQQPINFCSGASDEWHKQQCFE